MANEDPIQTEKFKGQCFRCKEPHLISDCKAKKQLGKIPFVTDVVRPYCSILPSGSSTDGCRI